MQRSIVALVVLFSLLTPAPALAWFGWLDHLSGPGPFRGLQFDLRLVCFGNKAPSVTRAEELTAAAELSERIAFASAGTERASVLWDNAAKAWQDAAGAWAGLASQWESATSSPELTLSEETKAPARAAPPNVSPQIAEAKRTAQQAREYVQHQRSIAALAGSIGVLVSLCPDDVVRRSSIDVASDFMWAGNNVDYVRVDPIRLSSVKAAYSYRLLNNPRFDILDAAMGVGLYWFSSRGFAPVRGLFIEPSRLYLHAPTSWSTKTWRDDPWRRLAAVPVFSWGLVVFPRGFEPNAFGNNERIRAELLNTFSIFVNVHPGKRSKDKN